MYKILPQADILGEKFDEAQQKIFISEKKQLRSGPS